MTCDSLVATVRAQARAHPDRGVLLFPQGDAPALAHTYEALDRDARRYAGVLRANDVRPGDRVPLVFTHGYELAAAFWGALYHGAVPLILPYADGAGSPAARQRRLAQLVAVIDARAVLCLPELHAEVAQGCVAHPAQALCLTADVAPVDDSALSTRGGEDIAYIQFSSGTTGVPSGAMLSHRAVLNNVQAGVTALGLDTRTVSVGWLPLYHDMGLVSGVIQPVLTGSLSVLIAPSAWVRQPHLLFHAIDRYRGTTVWMPNFAFSHCLRTVRDEQLQGLDLSCWQFLGNGSEPVQTDVLQRFADRFAPWGFSPETLAVAYGMAENVMGVSMTPRSRRAWSDVVSIPELQSAQRATPVRADRPGAKAIASCGPPVPGVRVQVVDETGHPLPERHVGEIVIAGPSLFSGYVGDAKRTASVMRDGWFRTGDLGYLVNGELCVCDRLKDLIIVGGRNIFPESIETLALDTLGEQGRKVAAFGVMDPATGTELPVLICELRGDVDAVDATRLAGTVRARVRTELGVTLADVCTASGLVERTTSGKVARGATRKKYLAAGHTPQPPVAALSPALIADPVALEEALLALFRGTLGADGLTPDDNLFEAGADSLALVRLLLRVEAETGVRVPHDFLRAPTVGHLRGLLVGDPAPARAPVSRAAESLPSRGRPSRLRTLPQRVRVRLRRRLESPTFRRPYFEGVQELLTWCDRSWVQTVLYPQESRLVRDFAVAMDTPADQIAQEVRVRLATFSINTRPKSDRNLPLKQAPMDAADLRTPHAEAWHTHFEVEGGGFLEEVIGRQRGLVCVGPHSYTPLAVHRLLESRFPACLMVGESAYRAAWQELLEPQSVSLAAGRAAAQTSVALAAARVLAEGGAICIYGDQEDTRAGLPVVIGDRQHRLGFGFAELAIATGAEILPVYTRLLLDGRIRIQWCAPLVWDRSAAREVQLRQILQAYAECQTELWRQAPGTLALGVMRQHLACPRVGD